MFPDFASRFHGSKESSFFFCASVACVVENHCVFPQFMLDPIFYGCNIYRQILYSSLFFMLDCSVPQ